ncbi:Smr/MutS family protein [Streptomyces sp. NPDC006476]|uniref:Smr/MutS family protein n=1 Tax=Streptomyces TaxID=1883 RepID=UPI000765A223|nr:Smr/MutS family protein [Streptomyces mirabilis]MCX4428663.1 Smr/MutS family protein [Streptomyces mirabilis]
MITVDLHPIFKNNRDIELTLRQTLFKAAHMGEDAVQFIPGKGSGQLKQRVLTFLAQKHIKKLYHAVETPPGNSGRIIVRMAAPRSRSAAP